MKDVKMKINGVIIREEGIRSVEKKDGFYAVDSISRGMMFAKTEEDIAEVEKYIHFIKIRSSFLNKRLLKA